MDQNKAIKEWIEDEIAYQSMERFLYLCASELDDSFAWGSLLCGGFMHSAEKNRDKGGLLLTGPDGCGKHTAAYHLVKYLCGPDQWPDKFGEEAYQPVFIGRDDLDILNDDATKVYDHLNALLDHYEGKKICMVVDDLGRDRVSKELLKRLGQFACMYYAHREYAHLLLIIIANDEKLIPAILRERLILCRMSLPDREARYEYIKNNKALNEFFDTAVSSSIIDQKRVASLYDELAGSTDGMTYAGLRDMCYTLVMHLEYDRWDYENIVKTQLPVDNRILKEQRFYDKMAEFAKLLPIGYPVTEGGRNGNTENGVQSGDSIPRSNAEIIQTVDNMTGYELLADLFGKEKADAMLERAEQLKNESNFA